MTVAELVRRLGIPGNYVGYRQLICAIELVTENEDCILNVYRDVYAIVGKKFHTSAVNIEKNIRTVLQAAWQRNNYTSQQFELIAGYSSITRPSTSEFLNVTSNYLRCIQPDLPESKAASE